MAQFDQSLLDLDDESINKQLLLDNLDPTQQLGKKPSFAAVHPLPGYCIKTRTEKDEKVFINVCTAENLPIPKEISDEELVRVIESGDASDYRIPMSLGEPHAEIDKSGKGCTAYDVVIHPKFLKDMETRQILQGFFMTIVLEGIEHKYKLALSRSWLILKHRKFVGTLPEQNIRTESKPWIMEMDGSQGPGSTTAGKGLISEVPASSSPAQSKKPKAPEPPYTIIQEPAEGHPDFLVAELHLVKVKSAESMTLDIGEDRLVLETRSNVCHLDIYLPYNIVQEECGAQFDKKSKILTITMPVQPL